MAEVRKARKRQGTPATAPTRAHSEESEPGDEEVVAPRTSPRRAPPGRGDRFALQATLSDLARASDTNGADHPAPGVPSLAGREALAALAAEVAQASARTEVANPEIEEVDSGSQPEPRSRPLRPLTRPRPLRPLVANREDAETGDDVGAREARTPLRPLSRMLVGADLDDPEPRVERVAAEPVAADTDTETDDDQAISSLPVPKATLIPGGPRILPGSGLAASNGFAGLSAREDKPARVEDTPLPTIELRRRPLADGPASVAAAPVESVENRAPEAAPKPAPPTIAAWSPRDDDILPGRPARRGRSIRLSLRRSR